MKRLNTDVHNHAAFIDIDVEGSLSLDDTDDDTKVSAEAAGPLPLIGLLFDYHFTHRWTAGAHGQLFYLNVSDDIVSFSGSLANLRLHTEYWFFNNICLGAAMNWFNLDVEVDDSDWKGNLNYQYFGPQVYASLRF